MKAQQILQADERLRIAIRLRGLDVDALDSAALKAAWRDLGAFLGHEKPLDSYGGLRFQMVTPTGQDVTHLHRNPFEAPMRKELSACVVSARTLLDRHVAGETVAAQVDGPVTARITPDGFSFRTPGRAGMFQLVLVYLLAEVGPDRVRPCPECGQLFLRVRRQIYCSAACTDRATWRNYPDAKKRRARKKQYDKHGWKLGARSRGKRKGEAR